MKLKRCDYCGASIQNYKYGFSKRYAYALKALYLANKPIKILHLDLSHGQADHFYLFQFWGVAERHATKKHHWIITQKGIDFLMGKIKIPKYIWTFRREHIPQPENDKTENTMITVFETGVELINKEIAIANSTPHEQESNQKSITEP